MLDLTYALPEVSAAHTALRDAEKAFRKHILEYQSTCSHPQVLEAPIRRYEYLGCRPDQAFRVCRCCGFTENGGYGSTTSFGSKWQATVDDEWYRYAPETKLGTEFAKEVTREEAGKYIIKIKE